MQSYLAAFLLAFNLLANSDACVNRGLANDKHNNQKNMEKIVSGEFTADLPKTPGFVKLEIAEDGTATLLNVVTIHLPPVEIERLKTKISRTKNDQLCFETKPKTIEPCLISVAEDEIVVKLVSENVELKLTRIKN